QPRRRHRIGEAQVQRLLAIGEHDRDLGAHLLAPLVTEEVGEHCQRSLEVVDHDTGVEQIGAVHGSITTRIEPDARSLATRNASAASSIGKRCVMTVFAISGSSASIWATSSISRRPSWVQ